MIKKYYKDILLVMLIKLLALGIIWAICFSHPLDKKYIEHRFKKIII